MSNKTIMIQDPWEELKQFTSARIALGRAGGSLATTAWLDFKLSHAKARDAVHCEFNSEQLAGHLESLGRKVITVHSQIDDRARFLQRPDLGRCVNHSSISIIEAERSDCDLLFIISDGLSATAVHLHAVNLLSELLPKFNPSSWRIAPIVIAPFARVALQDEIGALIGAKIAVILIGERPGLGSPDSLGAYMVHNPQLGNTDADRNCVSNIRPEGLDYARAAETLFYLIDQSRKRAISGVALKDDRDLVETIPNGRLSSSTDQ